MILTPVSLATCSASLAFAVLSVKTAGTPIVADRVLQGGNVLR